MWQESYFSCPRPKHRGLYFEVTLGYGVPKNLWFDKFTDTITSNEWNSDIFSQNICPRPKFWGYITAVNTGVMGVELLECEICVRNGAEFSHAQITLDMWMRVSHIYSVTKEFISVLLAKGENKWLIPVWGQ